MILTVIASWGEDIVIFISAVTDLHTLDLNAAPKTVVMVMIATVYDSLPVSTKG